MSRKPFVPLVPRAVAACMAVAALALLAQDSMLQAGSYVPCQLPVVVGSAVKPNVMIIQDMSGSMQAAAYYDSALGGSYYSNSKRACMTTNDDGDYMGISPLSGDTAYLMKTGYYGTADTDYYYKYNTGTTAAGGGFFELLGSTDAPSSLVNFTAVSKQGTTTSDIIFTAKDHGLAVDDYAAFYDLTSHVGMNGKAYKVTAVSGDTFTVNTDGDPVWNGTADTTAGKVVKRVVLDTSFAAGINGTVLNWLLTTRTDAAMKAFIGGRAAVTDSSYAYLQYQGQRRFLVDDTLCCLAYITPGTTTSPTGAYNTTSYYGDGSSYPYKDMYMTVSNYWTGTLNSSDPFHSMNSTYRYNRYCYAESYYFTLSSAAKVTIRMFSQYTSWTPAVYLFSVNTSTGALTPVNNTTYGCKAYGTTQPSTSKDACATLTTATALPAGTYCIQATTYSQYVSGDYYLAVTYEEDSVDRGGDPNVTLTKGTDSHHDGVLHTSRIGSILNAQCRIRQPLASRAGVVQNSFASVRFGYMFYHSLPDLSNGSTDYSNRGKILVGCDNTSLSTLINAISGIGSQTVNGTTITFTDCIPYYGTPTADGLKAAFNYFSQGQTSSTYDTTTLPSTNSAFLDHEKITDPYYGPDLDSSSNPMAVICRKSFVLLISDGQYTSGTGEPCAPALALHTLDLRPDLDDPTTTTTSGNVTTPQTATVYSIFAFDTATGGSNSMKGIAMFGGFSDVSNCGDEDMPYSRTSVPSDSRSLTWPRTDYCDTTTGGTYNETCCKEWDSIWTREGEETNANKGIPDNYFEASDGQKLETALKSVLQQVIASEASASAVATVSQQLSTGDTVIRGVFEASDPDNASKYLWYGHMEAYWPFKWPSNSSTNKYDFDLTCNDGLRCEEMPGTGDCPTVAHCWDAAKILMDRDLDSDPRWIFTATYDSSTKKWSTLDFSLTKDSDGNVTAFAPTAAQLGLTSDDDAKNLINWTFGNWVSGLRERGATMSSETPRRLGDILYSTPVVGGPPSVAAVSMNDPNVRAFWAYRNQTWATDVGCKNRTCVKNSKNEVLYRDKVVYVGANDGMVHAFVLAKWDATDSKWLDQAKDYNTDSDRVHDDVGREIWAYVPSNLLKKLNVLAQTTYASSDTGGCPHRAMVDLSDQVFEVFIIPPGSTGTTREWRSVLVGGERAGGDTYFALDVTDPYDPQVLWEYSVIKDRVVLYGSKAYQPFGTAVYDSMCDFPMSWTQPALGRVQLPDKDYYVGSPGSSGSSDLTGVDKKNFDTVNSDDQTKRHVVFVGGGLHLFDSSVTTTSDATYTSTQWTAFKKGLFQPALIVIDVETGVNLFKYIWPKVVEEGGTTVFPEITRGTSYTIPYAMSDPVAIDIWNPVTDSPSDDGFTDRVYLGDMTGRLYGVKFTPPNAAVPGMKVDIWKTRLIEDDTELASNLLRSDREPIAASPSITFEAPVVGSAPYLRIIFAGGKYEDIVGATDDKTDKHKTSLYNLRDAAALPVLGSSAKDVYSTGYKFELEEKCGSMDLNTGCTWTKGTDQADCCEGSTAADCDSACYKCVYDLTHATSTTNVGERFTAKPLIAGGYVFATSFVPSSDPCTFMGTGYLYIFTYLCEPLSEDITIVGTNTNITVNALTTSGGDPVTTGVQVTLGEGMPSKPVLDSAGENVIVQMSDGTLLRVPVTLALKPLQTQGWQEK